MFYHEYTMFIDIHGKQPEMSTFKDMLEIADESDRSNVGIGFFGGWRKEHGADFKIRFYEQLALTCMQLVKELKQVKKDAEAANESQKTTTTPSVES